MSEDQIKKVSGFKAVTRDEFSTATEKKVKNDKGEEVSVWTLKEDDGTTETELTQEQYDKLQNMFEESDAEKITLKKDFEIKENQNKAIEQKPEDDKPWYRFGGPLNPINWLADSADKKEAEVAAKEIEFEKAKQNLETVKRNIQEGTQNANIDKEQAIAEATAKVKDIEKQLKSAKERQEQAENEKNTAQEKVNEAENEKNTAQEKVNEAYKDVPTAENKLFDAQKAISEQERITKEKQQAYENVTKEHFQLVKYQGKIAEKMNELNKKENTGFLRTRIWSGLFKSTESELFQQAKKAVDEKIDEETNTKWGDFGQNIKSQQDIDKMLTAKAKAKQEKYTDYDNTQKELKDKKVAANKAEKELAEKQKALDTTQEELRNKEAAANKAEKELAEKQKEFEDAKATAEKLGQDLAAAKDTLSNAESIVIPDYSAELKAAEEEVDAAAKALADAKMEDTTLDKIRNADKFVDKNTVGALEDSQIKKDEAATRAGSQDGVLGHVGLSVADVAAEGTDTVQGVTKRVRKGADWVADKTKINVEADDNRLWKAANIVSDASKIIAGSFEVIEAGTAATTGAINSEGYYRNDVIDKSAKNTAENLGERTSVATAKEGTLTPETVKKIELFAQDEKYVELSEKIQELEKQEQTAEIKKQITELKKQQTERITEIQTEITSDTKNIMLGEDRIRMAMGDEAYSDMQNLIAELKASPDATDIEKIWKKHTVAIDYLSIPEEVEINIAPNVLKDEMSKIAKEYKKLEAEKKPITKDLLLRLIDVRKSLSAMVNPDTMTDSDVQEILKGNTPEGLPSKETMIVLAERAALEAELRRAEAIKTHHLDDSSQKAGEGSDKFRDGASGVISLPGELLRGLGELGDSAIKSNKPKEDRSGLRKFFDNTIGENGLAGAVVDTVGAAGNIVTTATTSFDTDTSDDGHDGSTVKSAKNVANKGTSAGKKLANMLTLGFFREKLGVDKEEVIKVKKGQSAKQLKAKGQKALAAQIDKTVIENAKARAVEILKQNPNISKEKLESMIEQTYITSLAIEFDNQAAEQAKLAVEEAIKNNPALTEEEKAAIYSDKKDDVFFTLAGDKKDVLRAELSVQEKLADFDAKYKESKDKKMLAALKQAKHLQAMGYTNNLDAERQSKNALYQDTPIYDALNTSQSNSDNTAGKLTMEEALKAIGKGAVKGPLHELVMRTNTTANTAALTALCFIIGGSKMGVEGSRELWRAVEKYNSDPYNTALKKEALQKGTIAIEKILGGTTIATMPTHTDCCVLFEGICKHAHEGDIMEALIDDPESLIVPM